MTVVQTASYPFQKAHRDGQNVITVKALQIDDTAVDYFKSIFRHSHNLLASLVEQD